MKKINNYFRLMLYLMAAIILFSGAAEAQRMKHNRSSRGHKSSQSKSSSRQKQSINGGHKKSSSRDLSKNKNTTKSNNRNNTKNSNNKVNSGEIKIPATKPMSKRTMSILITARRTSILMWIIAKMLM